MKWLLCVSCLLAFLTACQQDDVVKPLHVPQIGEIPPGFPDIDVPEGNTHTAERWALGKKLFFDPILSVDSTVSCASCHQAALAFSDDLAFSPGVANRPGTRNAPTLANVAYHPYFTREGGVPTLEMQVLVPIQEHNEFDFNIVLLAERLASDTTYVKLAQSAYNRSPDPFVITRALACFERSLISGWSPYDLYTAQETPDALTASAKRGMDLFFSEKTNCASCHGGFNFTNYAFENNGLYKNYTDLGRFRLTGKEEDRALFKVPSLRNIELTGPYMHDGSLHSLEEVIAHYQSGGQDNDEKSSLIHPLQLSSDEKNDLIQFLHALTDQSFVQNPVFKNQ